MTRVIVSEKTLEINVTAELLTLIRSVPGCGSAFWIGMKQRQEARNGIDDLISNVPRGYHLALQFKAPRPTPRNGNPFTFSLSERQHGHLCRLASVRPEAVHYVLPQINTFQAVRTAAPDLLQRTIGIAVADLAWLPPGRHKIESRPGGVSVFSEFAPVIAKPVREIVQSVFEGLNRDALLSHEKLQVWLEEMFISERENASAIGQRLRGFSTLCVPM